ncbi:MAG: flagellar filament capping protein FliD, partial [Deltaproteobacteria bacterium]|nr:flagellar filament capping protein FliD [Deltaproteobacteria bacterium]
MSLSTNLISGLSSGFDWRTMIDQLMEIEHRRVDLVENQKSDYEAKLEIYQSINTKLLSFKTTADTLSNSDAFNIFTTSLSTDSATYDASDILSVSTSTSAAPGSHTITMNANSTMAKSRKISSKSFSSYDTALSLTGEFVINGRAIKVETSDTLNDIQNKINNLNSGSNATGVTASILTVSSSNYRLILTSDNTGEDAFTIFDASADTENILSTGLGFTDETTTVKNLISNGARSESFSSSSQSVKSMLGLTTAQSGTVTIGSFTVDVDLSDSLTDIASDINTAAGGAGSSVTASVVSTTQDGVTSYRLKIENTTNFTDDNNVLQTLGILEGDHSSVTEVHLSDTANTLTTAGGGPGNITAGTEWGKIDTGGDANNVTNNDTITFTGTNHIGTSISGSYTITDKTTDTVQGLLTAIENAFAAVDEGIYTVTASIENGKIKITDDTSGDSQLTLSITTNNEGGGTLDLGTVTASTEGYTMQLQAGQDANVIINGTAITSSSNIIDDAIAGVTLNLLTVESGTTVNITISRDYDTIKSSVQELLNQYNDVMKDINEQFAYDEETETGGLLQGDGTLYSIKWDLVQIVTGTIAGLPSTLNALSHVGITSDNNGMLSIDDDDFKDAFNDDFNGLKRIFIAEGSTTDGDVEYIGHTNDTLAGEYEVNITQAATQASVTGSTALTSGIGAANIETLTITQGSKTAGIILNGAAGGNATSIDDIVNSINSELDTEYAQSLMGNVKNTTDAGQTTAITNTTTWDSVYSGGVAAGLSNGNTITFTGHKKNGTAVTGSYTITDVTTDTVQGLLSAIEAAYDNEVSASINTYGYITVTDKTTGNSNLDITITEPGSLNFGDVTTSNLVGSVRNTTGGGASAITAATKWNAIDNPLQNGDVIKFSGYTVNGSAVEGSYTVADAAADDVDDLLTTIETAYNAAGGSVTAQIQDGRIVIKDGTSNSTLGIEIFEPTTRNLDFGTLSGGITGRYSIDVTASKDGSDQLVLTHNDYGSSASFSISQSGADLNLGAITAGVDVAGTINGESATGSGQLLTGDDPGSGSSSVEGLTIKYTGTTTGSQGTVKLTLGVAELFERTLYDITNISDGYLDFKIESVSESIDDFTTQIQEMEDRLDRKMENMINRFVTMELTLSQIQSQSNWLTGQINAAAGGW